MSFEYFQKSTLPIATILAHSHEYKAKKHLFVSFSSSLTWQKLIRDRISACKKNAETYLTKAKKSSQKKDSVATPNTMDREHRKNKINQTTQLVESLEALKNLF